MINNIFVAKCQQRLPARVLQAFVSVAFGLFICHYLHLPFLVSSLSFGTRCFSCLSPLLSWGFIKVQAAPGALCSSLGILPELSHLTQPFHCLISEGFRAPHSPVHQRLPSSVAPSDCSKWTDQELAPAFQLCPACRCCPPISSLTLIYSGSPFCPEPSQPETQALCWPLYDTPTTFASCVAQPWSQDAGSKQSEDSVERHIPEEGGEEGSRCPGCRPELQSTLLK
ncbi:PREDICTED: uncharacterized protein LOC105996704 [Dipodomys ordii]|uniref:Uncharacterized protein LOC105996704 n=1 Tax=Dipodomys ordii TaxID=10020 RepID=A0A1S3GDM5_DIPOR|nr:PREDICTED: uncharacterized protein LOC105996704 [Dipodomys ordii]